MRTFDSIDSYPEKKDLVITIGCGDEFAYRNIELPQINLAYDKYEHFLQLKESVYLVADKIRDSRFENILYIGACKEAYAGVLQALRLKELLPDKKIGVLAFYVPSCYFFERFNYDFSNWDKNYPLYPWPLEFYFEPLYSKVNDLMDLKHQFEMYGEKGVRIFLKVLFGESDKLDRLFFDKQLLSRIDEFIDEKEPFGADHRVAIEIYKKDGVYNQLVVDFLKKMKSFH